MRHPLHYINVREHKIFGHALAPIFAVFFALFMFSILSFAGQAFATSGISGTVTYNSNPVEGATVTLCQWMACNNAGMEVAETVTTVSGTYQFSGLSDNVTYYAYVDAVPYAHSYDNSIMIPGGTSTLNVALVMGGSVSGKITRQSDAANLEGVTVTLENVPFTTSTVTDASGDYTFTRLAADTYDTIRVSLSGYVNNTESDISVTASNTTTQNLTMQQAGSIAGTLQDCATSEAITGDMFNLNVNGPANGGDMTDSGTGAYSITGLIAGSTYQLSMSGAGGYYAGYYNSSTASNITVTAGATTTINLCLEELVYGTVIGTVTDNTASSTPLASASYSCNLLDGGGLSYGCTGESDGSGEYEFDLIGGYSYDITFSKSGYIGQTSSSVYIGENTTTTVNFELPLAGTVTGTIYQTDCNTPFTDTSINMSINKDGGGSYSASSDMMNGGVYSNSSLLAGTYTISYSSFEYGGTTYQASSTSGITVTAGETTAGVDFCLEEQQYGAIEGTIRNSLTTSTLITNATVNIDGGCSSPCNSALYSTPSGYYSFYPVAVGSRGLSITAGGYSASSTTAVVTADTTTTADIYMDPTETNNCNDSTDNDSDGDIDCDDSDCDADPVCIPEDEQNSPNGCTDEQDNDFDGDTDCDDSDCSGNPACGPTTRDVCAEGCTYSTIQAAIDAASDDDIVTIATGTYMGFEVNAMTGLTIRGTGAASATIITSTTLDQAVLFTNSANNNTLQNLTINNVSSTEAYAEYYMGRHPFAYDGNDYVFTMDATFENSATGTWLGYTATVGEYAVNAVTIWEDEFDITDYLTEGDPENWHLALVAVEGMGYSSSYHRDDIFTNTSTIETWWSSLATSTVDKVFYNVFTYSGGEYTYNAPTGATAKSGGEYEAGTPYINVDSGYEYASALKFRSSTDNTVANVVLSDNGIAVSFSENAYSNQFTDCTISGSSAYNVNADFDVADQQNIFTDCTMNTASTTVEGAGEIGFGYTVELYVKNMSNNPLAGVTIIYYPSGDSSDSDTTTTTSTGYAYFTTDDVVTYTVDSSGSEASNPWIFVATNTTIGDVDYLTASTSKSVDEAGESVIITMPSGEVCANEVDDDGDGDIDCADSDCSDVCSDATPANFVAILAAAEPDDVINMGAGTYAAFEVPTSSLTFIGAGQGSTIISAGEDEDGIYAEEITGLTLQDLTIQNASSTYIEDWEFSNHPYSYSGHNYHLTSGEAKGLAVVPTTSTASPIWVNHPNYAVDADEVNNQNWNLALFHFDDGGIIYITAYHRADQFATTSSIKTYWDDYLSTAITIDFSDTNVFTYSDGSYTYNAPTGPSVLSGGDDYQSGTPAISGSTHYCSGIYLDESTGLTASNLTLQQNAAGVYFYISNTSTLSNLTITDNSFGLFYVVSTANIISSSTISNSATSDLAAYLPAGYDNTILNSTLNTASTTWTNDGGGSIIVNYSARAYTQNASSTAISGASVSYVSNESGGSISLGTTDASGYTDYANLPMVVISSSTVDYNDWGFTAVKSGYATTTVTSTINTKNQTVDITMDEAVAEAAPVLSEYSVSNSNGEVTVNFTVDDVNDDILSAIVLYATSTPCVSSVGELPQPSEATLVTSTAEFAYGSPTVSNSNGDDWQITNLPTDGGANTVTTTWNSNADLPSINGTYCVYVVANQGGPSGMSNLLGTTVAIENLDLGNVIHGTITSGGSPVAGALVSLSGAASTSTVSGLSGGYQFTNLDEGTYNITVTKLGYDQDSSGPHSLTEGNSPITANVSLSAAAPTIVDAEPGDGMEFADVYATVAAEMSTAPATSTIIAANVSLQVNTGNTQEGAPTGSNLCNSVMKYESYIMCDHDILEVDTWYTFTIGTGVTNAGGTPLAAASLTKFKTSGFSGNDMTMPPFVHDTMPGWGVQDFAINGSLFVFFPDDDSGAMKTTGDYSVLSASNISLQLAQYGQPTGSNLCTSGGCTLTWDSDSHILKINPASNLTANTEYFLTISKTTQNDASVALAGGNEDFMTSFRTNGEADSTGPSFESMYPGNGSTGIEHNVGNVAIYFDEAMDPSTITSSTVYLFNDVNSNSEYNGAGEDFASDFAELEFDPLESAAYYGLNGVFSNNQKVCALVSPGATDVSGNNATDATKCFTVSGSSYSAVAPKVEYVEANNFMIWLEFDQPVDVDDAEEKDNYALQICDDTTTCQDMSIPNAEIDYNGRENAVEIWGVGLPANSLLKITVTGVAELSGSVDIVANGTTNVAYGYVQDHEGDGAHIGNNEQDWGQSTDMGDFWENPERCMPFNKMPGVETGIECEFSTPVALTTGAKLVIEVNSNFDISGVGASAAADSFFNADLNGWGQGETTISNVAINNTAHTITLTLAHTGDSMLVDDKLRFELNGLVNSEIAGEKQWEIKVKDADGILQGTINPSPFTIKAAGSRTISGTVCKASDSNGDCTSGVTAVPNIRVVLDGPVGWLTTESDGSGNYSFANLPAGHYELKIMDFDGIDSAGLGGGNTHNNISLSDSDATDVDFRFKDMAASGTTVTFNISGGPASEEVDVFCFAPGNYEHSRPAMKKLTLNGSGAASDTLKLEAGETYECGVGPHIPFDSFSESGGPPPMADFTFMPPVPQQVYVESGKTVNFELTVAAHRIIGKVVDGDGTGIANVFVDAFPPFGSFDDEGDMMKGGGGSFAQSKSDGTFILNVTDGIYEVSVCAPGLPCTRPIEVTVRDNDTNADNNTNADVYKGGNLVTGTGLNLKMSKSGITIAGQVLDADGDGIQYAFVDAMQIQAGGTCSDFTPVGGFSGSPTDSSGNYTIYVNNGTWRLAAFSGSYGGEVGCSILTVSGGTSLTGQNIQYDASNVGTVVVNLAKTDGTDLSGGHVGCWGPAGGNGGKTGGNGSVTLKLRAGSDYMCEGFVPGVGRLATASFDVVAGQTYTKNLTTGNPGTIQIDLGTITDGFCDAWDSSGRGHGTGQNNAGVYSLNLPAGTYDVFCGSESVREVGSQSNVVVTADQTTEISFTPPTLYTITGRVVNGSEINLEGASVNLVSTNNQIIFTQSNAASGSNNNVSVSVPAGTYEIFAGKSGYMDTAAAQTLTVVASTSFTTRELEQTGASVAVTVKSGGSNYLGGAKVIAVRQSDNRVIVTEVDRTVTSGSNAAAGFTNGTWSVEAFADNGTKSSASTVVVANDNPSPSTLTLSLSETIADYTVREASQQSMVPSDGGIYRDTNIGDGFEVQIPSNVLSTSDSSAGTIETKLNPTLAFSTADKQFVGNAAIDITPKDANGTALREVAAAGERPTVKIPFTDADVIAAGVEKENMVIGIYSDSAGEWQFLPTTVDTVNNILTAQTSHFSTFAPLAPIGGGGAPDTPTGLAGSAMSTTRIDLTWNAVVGVTGYDIYRDTDPSGAFPRLGSEPTVAAGVTTYSDTGLTASTLYYYKVSALNGVGESTASSAVSATTNSGPGSAPATPPTVAEDPEATHQTVLADSYAVDVATEITVGASTHTVTVLSVSEDEVTVKIESDPVQVTVKVGEYEDVDTDNDGIDDLRVEYTALVEGAAQLTFTNLTDAGELEGSMTINSGAYETDFREVSLSFNATKAVSMAISERYDLYGAQTVAYKSLADWTLSSGNGKKTVYVKLFSSSGDYVTVIDSIYLVEQVFEQLEEPEIGDEVLIVEGCFLQVNRPYKVASHPGIYYLTEDCTKRPFNRAEVYFTYFGSWDEVRVITQTELDRIPKDNLNFMPWGPLYKPKYGSIVKTITNPKIYMLFGIQKHWITSGSVFEALKYSWNWVEDVADSVLDRYKKKADIDYTDHHPNYSLIKYENDSKVYILMPDPGNPGGQMKRHIKDEITFNNLGYRWDTIATIEDTEAYPDGVAIEHK